MLHNALSAGAELIKGFRNLVGLDISEDGVGRLGETLTPVLDAWSRPEFAFCRGEKLLFTMVQVAAGGAGNFGHIMINNTTRDTIIIIDSVASDIISSYGYVPSAAAVVTGAAAVVAGGHARDTRLVYLGNQIVGACPVLTNAVAVGGASGFVRIGGAVTVELPVIVTPGFAFALVAGNNNVAMIGSICWRERKAMPGELNR